MSGFGNNFLKGFFGNDFLKDYTHASKTFRSGGYELAPRQKYLYYVRFNLNSQIRGLDKVFSNNDRTDLGLLVKSVDLPSYTFDVDVQNQYNRKRLVQKKIEYQPVQLVMHDDGSDLARQIWYNYYAYYFKDPSKSYNDLPTFDGSSGSTGNQFTDKGNYNVRDTYVSYQNQNDWGYIGESYTDNTSELPGGGKPRFFNDITIYGFNQHDFAAYVLINPLIVEYKHDTYDYTEDNGIMQNTMRLQYETVKYYSGRLSGTFPDTNATGFADANRYDTVGSPLRRPGAETILGVGGAVDQIAGFINDIQNKNFLGAVQRAGGVYNTFKGKDLESVIENEGRAILQDIIRNPTQNRDFFIPKQTGTTNPTANQSNGLKTLNDLPQGPTQGKID